MYLYVTGIEIGMQNSHDGSCVADRGNRLGMPVDAQASQHDSTAHA